MLCCSDDSFYVGSTSYGDVNVRVTEHNEARYAGYTSARRPTRLVWSKWFDDLRDAHAMERQLKGWSRAKKMALANNDSGTLVQLSRRGSKTSKTTQRLPKRPLADAFHSVGRRHPEVAAKRPSKDDL